MLVKLKHKLMFLIVRELNTSGVECDVDIDYDGNCSATALKCDINININANPQLKLKYILETGIFCSNVLVVHAGKAALSSE